MNHGGPFAKAALVKVALVKVTTNEANTAVIHRKAPPQKRGSCVSVVLHNNSHSRYIETNNPDTQSVSHIKV